MTPERWRAVEHVLDGALDLAPDARPAFVARACGGDAELRREVERLLSACERVEERGEAENAGHADDAAGARHLLSRPAAEFAAPVLAGAAGRAARAAAGHAAAQPDVLATLRTALAERYTVEHELGRGGMAVVYLAGDVRHHRPVALKVVHPELAAAFGGSLGRSLGAQRFLREIAIAARLAHPHILPLHDSGEAAGLLYYVMPYVEGESLRARLARDGELPIAVVVGLLRDVAAALAYAHRQGVVHRDIKPENILLTKDGDAVVADFGVGKALAAAATASDSDDASSEPLTAMGFALGTPAYMAPEQAAADPHADHRADLYALGVVAYEMLTGAHPFPGRSAHALLAAHAAEAPEAVTKRRPGVPPALAALVMRCLEKRPADRPQRAEEVALARDALPTPGGGTEVMSGTSSRSVPRTMLAVLALVVVAAGAAWLSFGRRERTGAVASSRLLIAPFENLTGAPRFDHIGRIAADRLALMIAQGGSMDVVPSSIVLMALRDTTGGQAERLRRLAAATHAGLVVSGTVVLRGDSLTLQAQTTDVRTGKVAHTLDPATGPAADPIVAVDALGDHLLGALGSRQLPILPQDFRAPKHAAYQEFAKGFERFAVYGDFIGSRPFFERAIAIDSNYTRAYLLLLRQYLGARICARRLHGRSDRTAPARPERGRTPPARF
ncbi:MAG: serine/threonine-protein kinase [Gemmatimonadaceae bacterium]